MDCCGLLEGTAKRCPVVMVEGSETKTTSYAYSQYDSSRMAVAIGPELTIVTSLRMDKVEDKCEVEFDADIQIICWGVDAKCLIVGDSCGTLHFVTVTGELLFSRRVLSSK